MDKIRYIVNVLIVALLFAAVAIQKDGRVVGLDVEALFRHDTEPVEVPIDSELHDGTHVINTSSLAKDVIGFGGLTPVVIQIKEGRVFSVQPLENSETPSFFDEVVRSGLFKRWDGLTVDEAAQLEVDVVSGATYSSTAVIQNIQRAMQHAANVEINDGGLFANLELKVVAGIIVILLGVYISLSKSKNKVLMTLQLALNVAVLGVWCGSFLSLSTFTAWMANGVNLSMSLVGVVMLVAVLVMPLLGRKGTYCQLHCPMGSAQELLGRVPLIKIKIKPQVVSRLNNLRYYILSSLMFLMWLGVGFELMNYEVFSAFLFGSASEVVLVMAALFLTLSLFIRKPYCRFVCPTGALITITQKTK